MTSLSAVVDEFGISAPAYSDILASLQASYREIYGADIYIEADSQDGQLLALLALALSDSNQAAISTYNAFSPTTAVGAGLSSVIKVNGLRRLVPTFSTVPVLLVGIAGTPINNGIVSDDINLGTRWVLPLGVVIPDTGEISVTATSTTPGSVIVAPNTITNIVTPVPGWQTVNNPAGGSVPGLPVEPDATVRRRQAKSTATPAQTVREAIYGAVANVPGVGRLQVFENDTSATDSRGIPDHSIAVVAEGGDSIAIATAIASRKTPGSGTYGTILETIVDSHGVPDDIYFFELADIQISVIIRINPLSGYISTTGDTLKAAVVQYLSGAEIGTPSYWSRLVSPADLKGSDAVSSSALTQDQLDLLSATYDIRPAVGVAQARSDTVISGGPYAAGATAMTVVNHTDLATGLTGYVKLDDASFFQITYGTITGSTVNFTPAVPIGRNIPNGNLAYVVGDVHIAFGEATISTIAEVDLYTI